MPRTFTPEHREKLRRAHLGKTYPNRKPMSEEQKENMRIAQRKRWETLSTKQKQSFKINGWRYIEENRIFPQCPTCSRLYHPKLYCLFCKNL